MACPVNHPLFHALVFLIGVLVVLSRYARASPSSPADVMQSQMVALIALMAADMRKGLAGTPSLTVTFVES